MLPGYNHNVQYRQQVFHIQTEDSGLENPHVITHLFVGGNIIHTRKTSYANIVGDARRDELLVDIMQGQHKGMLKDLIKGSLNKEIDERSGNAGKLNGPAPLNVEAGAQHRASFGMPSAAPVAKPTPVAPVSPKPLAVPPPPPPTGVFAAADTNEKIITAEALEKVFDSKDEHAVDSIFGEDLISEKSLDEVILSYLAEDMTSE